jgi:hypothetical protein
VGVAVRFLQLLGLNLVPVAGMFFGGWSPATALALYWLENVVGGALVAARIAIHRERTDARGHYRRHLGVEITSTLKVAGRDKPVDVTPKTLLGELLFTLVAFSAGHGIVLFVLLVLMMNVTPDRAELRTGAIAMVGIQLIGFAVDLPRLGERPFAWIKTAAERSVARVVLVHLAILGGAFLTFGRPHPERFFLAFGALKLASDLASWLPLALPPPDPNRPPSWIARFAGAGFAEYWRKEAMKERAANEDDERPRRGRNR